MPKYADSGKLIVYEKRTNEKERKRRKILENESRILAGKNEIAEMVAKRTENKRSWLLVWRKKPKRRTQYRIYNDAWAGLGIRNSIRHFTGIRFIYFSFVFFLFFSEYRCFAQIFFFFQTGAAEQSCARTPSVKLFFGCSVLIKLKYTMRITQHTHIHTPQRTQTI